MLLIDHIKPRGYVLAVMQGVNGKPDVQSVALKSVRGLLAVCLVRTRGGGSVAHLTIFIMRSSGKGSLNI